MLCELRRHQCYLDIYYYKGGSPPRYMADKSDIPSEGKAEPQKVQDNNEAEHECACVHPNRVTYNATGTGEFICGDCGGVR